MKFVHLSDLHIGKYVNGFSMIGDQKYILWEILRILEAECPDAVLIAGDIYDKSVPSAEAVGLFDAFLWRLSKLSSRVFVISGNHDSPERLSFGSRLMDQSGVYLSPVYNGTAEMIECRDAIGPVRFYLLPFLKPAAVRAAFPDQEIRDYTDALRIAVDAMQVEKKDDSVRNVLLSHQFVTGAERAESEELSIGGLDNVDASVFAGFDYVALGHLHRPQTVGGPAGTVIRYCGTPLRYSFSECRDHKSLTLVELGEKGAAEIRTIPLIPLHELRELRGSYMELTAKENYAGTKTEDYLHITLTDEFDVPDAIGKLRVIYPNLMKLDYDNTRTRAQGELPEFSAQRMRKQTPEELFAAFYETQNGQPMTDTQRTYLLELLERVSEPEGM
ncbi:MAG: exonuclease SbcCD subunit D [Eubacteriales bacterium]|nr:exonuclease SbcCD subunit D [Eubacteriales bacterium]